jgi:chaperonin GroEL
MIVENAGQEGSIVIQRVKEGKDDFGYNAIQINMRIFMSQV